MANGGLFAAYHLHVRWMMPVILLDAFALAWPAKRYRSAWVSIALTASRASSSRDGPGGPGPRLTPVQQP